MSREKNASEWCAMNRLQNDELALSLNRQRLGVSTSETDLRVTEDTRAAIFSRESDSQSEMVTQMRQGKRKNIL